MEIIGILDLLFSASQDQFNRDLARVLTWMVKSMQVDDKLLRWMTQAVAHHTELLVRMDASLMRIENNLDMLIGISLLVLLVVCVIFIFNAIALALIERHNRKNHLALMNEFYFMRQLFIPRPPA